MLSEAYLNRFSGIARIYGPEGLERLAASHVLVIGLGGVGSWVVEALARSGVGRMTLVDFDDICVSNFNRQIHAVDSSVGKFKVDEMAKRVRLINAECDVRVLNERFSEEAAEAILDGGYTYVIDAFDNSTGKSHLIHLCKKRKQPLLVLGSVGGKSDPSLIRIDDLSKSREDTLLSAVRKKLRAEYGFPKEKTKNLKCLACSQRKVRVFRKWLPGRPASEGQPKRA